MSEVVPLLQTDSDPFRLVDDFLNSPLLRLRFQLVILFFVVSWLALVYWGIVAFSFPFIGTLIYRIVRPPEYLLGSRERQKPLGPQLGYLPVLRRSAKKINR